jgi:predicted TIM-barrel fold metal-dependent hydrolase
VTGTDRNDNAGLLAALREGGLRYYLFPWVDPRTDFLPWLEQESDSVHGLKIHPTCTETKVTDPSFGPAFEYAGRRRLPVIVHCGRWQEMSGYELVLAAAERHPDVKWILAHMGGDTPPLGLAASAAVLDRGLDNVWFGLESFREYVIIRRIIGRIGPERVLFGSDFPLGHPRAYRAGVEALELGPEGERRVLGGNMSELLGDGLHRPLGALGLRAQGTPDSSRVGEDAAP